jgi:putative SOS response-associated peptidase YedK
MCSRYAMTSPPDAIKALFGHHNTTSFPPRYNIAPTQPVLIVRFDHAKRREIELVRWGLIPSWVKEPGKYAPLVNARAETAVDKPSFRGPLRHRRCLVPADCYYEWAGKAGSKRPYLIRPKAGGPFALAGLWDHWLGADGSEIETMAILTVEANVDAGAIHDRMPVILMPDQFEAWLDITSGRSGEAERLMRVLPAGFLEVLEISPKLNNSRSDGPETQEIIDKRLI